MLQGDLRRASLVCSCPREPENRSLTPPQWIYLFLVVRETGRARLDSARLARLGAPGQFVRLPFVLQLSSSKATPLGPHSGAGIAQQLQELAYKDALEVRITVTDSSPSSWVPS